MQTLSTPFKTSYLITSPRSIIISGGSGSGKSTLAASLAQQITRFQATHLDNNGAESIFLDPSNPDNVLELLPAFFRGQYYKGDPFLTTIFDDIWAWQKFPELMHIPSQAINHTIRYTRKTNQCHIFTVHNCLSSDFGGMDSGWWAEFLEISSIIDLNPEIDQYGRSSPPDWARVKGANRELDSWDYVPLSTLLDLYSNLR